MVAEWSPSGRVLLVATTAPRLRVDNGLTLYTYTGAKLSRQPYEVQWPLVAVDQVITAFVVLHEWCRSTLPGLHIQMWPALLLLACCTLIMLSDQAIIIPDPAPQSTWCKHCQIGQDHDCAMLATNSCCLNYLLPRCVWLVCH